MSIASIVTRGYGSFGSIADIARAGYDAAEGAGEVLTPQVSVTIVGDGESFSWEDHVKALHERNTLERQFNEQKKELRKVEKKLQVFQKKVKQERTEGVLANLWRLEQRKEEIEHKIQAIELNLEPLILYLEKNDIEEDDQEFMSLQ